MEHQSGPPHCSPADGFVAQVIPQELDVAQDGCQVLELPGRQVVEHPHALTERQQAFDEMGPDEAGAPADEGDRT